MNTPAVLLILDGYGLAEAGPFNAIEAADSPNLDSLRADRSCVLQASGDAVGLRPGLMGSSEVNHLNMGAGRVVEQDIVRIDKMIECGELADNKALNDALTGGESIHLVGLLSDGGVHSHVDHLRALLDIAAGSKKPVYLHAITDGRDTGKREAQTWLSEMDARDDVTISSISGRYYAMDRDNRWDRTQKAYEAMVRPQVDIEDWRDALKEDYGNDLSDEFIVPRSLPGKPIEKGDSVIFFSFREDRERQLAAAFTRERFDHFPRIRVENLHFVQMTAYDQDHPHPTILEPEPIEDVLAEWLSKHDVSQLHIAETEKYAHVTFFFNGGREEPFPGEDRVIIPSPPVATYDEVPAMSVEKITEQVVEDIGSGGHQAYIINFANCDMVGHTGDLDATIKAVEAVDGCVGRIRDAVLDAGGFLMVTADHGNAEDMSGDETTTHTTNPVPLMVAGVDAKLRDGIIPDVAPTFLKLFGLPIPDAMTARSLVND